jgi:hypothetical protein
MVILSEEVGRFVDAAFFSADLQKIHDKLPAAHAQSLQLQRGPVNPQEACSAAADWPGTIDKTLSR